MIIFFILKKFQKNPEKCLKLFIESLSSKNPTIKLLALEILRHTLILDYLNFLTPQTLQPMVKPLLLILAESKGELRKPGFTLSAILELKYGMTLKADQKKRILIDNEKEQIILGQSEVDFLDLFRKTFKITTRPTHHDASRKGNSKNISSNKENLFSSNQKNASANASSLKIKPNEQQYENNIVDNPDIRNDHDLLSDSTLSAKTQIHYDDCNNLRDTDGNENLPQIVIHFNEQVLHSILKPDVNPSKLFFTTVRLTYLI